MATLTPPLNEKPIAPSGQFQQSWARFFTLLVNGFLSLTGGTMTGPLQLNGAPGLILGKPLVVGALTGPTITTGIVAPTAAEPLGSIYINSAGAMGSTLYVARGGGTWHAVAGV